MPGLVHPVTGLQGGIGSSAHRLVGTEREARNNKEANHNRVFFTAESPFQVNCAVIMCQPKAFGLRGLDNFSVRKT
jgi:hypothetical protein